jgi:hypothetical protein
MHMAEARIFVSHAHSDAEWCRGFVDVLRKSGADVWYDEHDLRYGRLTVSIAQEIQERPIFIVVLSPASALSPWVAREMEAAMLLADSDASRVILPVVAAPSDNIQVFWRLYKWVAGPNGAALTPARAAEIALQWLIEGGFAQLSIPQDASDGSRDRDIDTQAELPRPIVIHHLSDLHFSARSVDVPEYIAFMRYASHMNTLPASRRPDLVAITGDLTDSGSEGALEAVPKHWRDIGTLSCESASRMF